MSVTDDSKDTQKLPHESPENIQASPLTIQEKREYFGKLLKQTREDLHQSQRDIIHLTRISPPFLQALEEGRFDALPGEVFGRGFLKNICKVLEVDSSSLLSVYNSCWDKDSSNTRHYSYKQKLGFKNRQKTSKSKKHLPLTNYFSMKGLMFWIALPALSLAIVAFIVIKSGILSSTSVSVEKIENSPPNTITDPVIKKEHADALDVENATTSSSSETVANQKLETQGNSEQKDEPAAKPIIIAPKNLNLTNNSGQVSSLMLEIKEQVEIKYRFDEEALQSEIYEPGLYDFKFKNRIDIFCQDMSKIDVTYNGRPFGHFGNNRDAKQLSFISKTQSFVKF